MDIDIKKIQTETIKEIEKIFRDFKKNKLRQRQYEKYQDDFYYCYQCSSYHYPGEHKNLSKG